MEYCDIVALKGLLCRDDKNNSDSDEKENEEVTAKEDSIDNAEGETVNPYSKKDEKPEDTVKKDIYNVDDETLYKPEENDMLNWKKTPVWDVSYKQKVTTSDLFLQIGGKNPTTASCEEMVLKIHLPGEDHHSVDIKVTESNLKLETPQYRMDLPLVQRVDPQKGSAQWDKDTENLIVTLIMVREFDYVNF